MAKPQTKLMSKSLIFQLKSSQNCILSYFEFDGFDDFPISRHENQDFISGCYVTLEDQDTLLEWKDTKVGNINLEFRTRHENP